MVFRDTSKAVSEDLVKRVLDGRVQPKYDEKYLKIVRDQLLSQKSFQINAKSRHTFENYTTALKKYTEQKFYSGN